MSPPPFETAFVLDSPLGHCVAVHLPRDDRDGAGLDLLHPLERQLAERLAPLRRTTWVGGRIALRRALADRPLDAPLLPTPRGAPALPPGVAGSISHKRTLAVAVAAPADAQVTLGVDLEQTTRRPVDIARRVLVPRELESIDALPEAQRWAALMIRFSIKEAVYKALDPFVERCIAFSEACVTLADPGEASVELHLRGGEGPFALKAWWLLREDYVVTVVQACRSVPRDL